MYFVVIKKIEEDEVVLDTTDINKVKKINTSCIFVRNSCGKFIGIYSKSDIKNGKYNKYPKMVKISRGQFTDAHNTEIGRKLFDDNPIINYLPVVNITNGEFALYVKMDYSNLKDWNNSYKMWDVTHWGNDAQKSYLNGSKILKNPLSNWASFLYPRLCAFLPSQNILEIACGMGRFSQFLIPLSKSFIGVDYSEIAICGAKKRFEQKNNANFFVTNGKDLSGVKSHSIDLVFEYESLCFLQMSEWYDYVKEIIRVLREGGISYIHHSNVGSLDGHLFDEDIVISQRISDVNAEKMKKMIEELGGTVLLQECYRVPYIYENSRQYLGYSDCITVFAVQPIKKPSKAPLIYNDFVREIWKLDAENLYQYSIIGNEAEFPDIVLNDLKEDKHEI